MTTPSPLAVLLVGGTGSVGRHATPRHAAARALAHGHRSVSSPGTPPAPVGRAGRVAE